MEAWPYDRLGSSEAKKFSAGEIMPMKKTIDKAESPTYNGRGRSTCQWIAARLFWSLGVVFYGTIPGINLNAGQSKFPNPPFFRQPA
jgi:hypothetical protein